MRLGFSNSKNGNPNGESAGNQDRKALGISGTEYDMSYMAKLSEEADKALGDLQCTITMTNVVARTANNVDKRVAAERLFKSGINGNFKFSVYFTKEQADEAIEANKHADRKTFYELDKIRKMRPDDYNKSMGDLMKMAAVRTAKKILSDNGLESITKAEWDRALAETGMKPQPFGINTFEFATRASSRDQSLKRGNANAWGRTEAGYEAATYNAAGTKTLPLFDDAQVKAAMEVSENTYKMFVPMAEHALKNPTDIKGIFAKYCEIANQLDKSVPKGWEQNYYIWSDKQRSEIEKMAYTLAGRIMG